MKKLLSLFILTLLPLLASADPVEIDGIYYKLEIIEKANIYRAIVTRSPVGYSGDIIIPESVVYEGTSYCVTSIEAWAFEGQEQMTSVTIPSSITTIGEGAFSFAYSSSCNLSAVHISDLVSWCNIDFKEGNDEPGAHNSNPLIYAHHLYLDDEEITNLIIPNSITSISNLIFCGCSGITSVTIPSSVLSIGGRAFSGCSGLTSLEIPNSVTTISEYAFYGCSGLKSLDISNSVTTIGEYAFSGCSGLTSLDIPNSVINFGISAFSNCTSLKSVSIPNNITSLESYTFDGCTSLTSIVIPSNITSIGIGVFWSCSGLTSVTIPNSVISIDNHAFDGCSSLSSIIVPNSVKTIGRDAFSNCSSLTTISIGTGIENISYVEYDERAGAFRNCSKLENVYCYAEQVPATCPTTFDGSYVDYATLHVPEDAIDDYVRTAPWSSFGNFATIDGTAFHDLVINVGKNGTVTYGTSNISNTSQTFNIKEGSDVTLTITPSDGYRLSSVTINNVDKTADVSEGTLVINNVSADVAVSVSFILDGGSDAVIITDAGVATFCSDKDLDFSEVSGLKAYTGAGFNKSTGQLILLEVTDVPAGTGLLLKGTAGSYEIPEKTSSSVFANLLVGVTTETALSQTDGGYTNYILGNGTNGPGFFKVSDAGGNLAAGKAYLHIPTSAAGARTTISLDFSGDASGICDIEYDATGREAWFNVQGRRLESAPTKAGLYIRNGKKYIVK